MGWKISKNVMLDFPEEFRGRLEQLVPDYHINLIEVKKLLEEVRKKRVIWRYNPIIFTPKYTTEYNFKDF